MKLPNHPNRPTLPYKVHDGGTKPMAAFALNDDAEEFARRLSLSSSITYRVRQGSETIKKYFRGEEVHND